LENDVRTDRTTAATAIAAALAALATLLAVAGCNEPPSAPTPRPNAASAPPSAAPLPPTYTMPDNLCQVVDFTVFQDITPTLSRAEEMLRRNGPTFFSATCAATLNGLHGGLILFIDVEIFRDELKARAQFQGIKGVTVGDYPDAHDVTGIGSAAYIYTHPALGPTLALHVGTANLKVSVTGIDNTDPIPTDAQRRLSNLANQILASLPRGHAG
jgi:hypothetical protein